MNWIDEARYDYQIFDYAIREPAALILNVSPALKPGARAMASAIVRANAARSLPMAAPYVWA